MKSLADLGIIRWASIVPSMSSKTELQVIPQDLLPSPD
jgi:hypothetical protein